jgi:hypothetical protein
MQRASWTELYTKKENSGNKQDWMLAKYLYCRKAVHPMLHPRRGAVAAYEIMRVGP